MFLGWPLGDGVEHTMATLVGQRVDLINVVAKRAGLSLNYRVFATWSETLAGRRMG